MDRHLDGSLGHTQGAGGLSVAQLRLVAGQVSLEAFELRLPTASLSLCFQSREHAVEKRHSPSPVEDFLWRLVVHRLTLETSLRALELQRNDRDATTTLPGDLPVVFVGREILQRCEQERPEPSPGGIGMPDRMFLENPREEGLRQVLGVLGAMSSAAKEPV